MEPDKPDDRLKDLTPADRPDSEPEVFAIRREKSGWHLSRRGVLEASLGASALLAGSASAQVRRPVKKQPVARPHVAPEPAADLPALRKLAHTAAVNAVAYSPDGTLVATASNDTLVKLWSTADNRLKAVLDGHRGAVTGLAFAHDGSFLASGSRDGTVRTWSLPTGQPLATFEVHSGEVLSLALTPDGKLLAAGTGNGEIRLFVAPQGPAKDTLKTGGGQVTLLAISPDGRTLASCSGFGSRPQLQLWSLPDGALKGTLAGHTGRLSALAFTPDGTLLASGSHDNSVRLWTVADAKPAATLSGHRNDVNTLAVLPDGRMLATGSDDNTVRLWSLPDGALVRTLSGHRNSVVVLAVAPDGRVLASSSLDNTLRLHSLPEGETLATFRLGMGGGVIQVMAFSPDGASLAAPLGEGVVSIWDVASRKFRGFLSDPAVDPVLAPEKAQPAHLGAIRRLALAVDGTVLVSASEDNTVKLWALKDASLLNSLPALADLPKAFLIAPDGRQALVAVGDKIEAYALPEGRRLATLEGHLGDVRSLAVASDGKLLLSAGDDGTVRLWTLPEGQPAGLLRAPSRKPLTRVLLSSDGHFVVAASETEHLHVWSRPALRYLGRMHGDDSAPVLDAVLAWDGDTIAWRSYRAVWIGSLRGMKLLGKLGEPGSGTGTLLFSPDSKLLMSVVGEQIRFWAVPDRKLTGTLHGSSSTALALDPQAKILAATDNGGAIRLWSLERLRELCTFKLNSQAASLVFTADGRSLASGDEQGNLARWDIDPPAFRNWFADPALESVPAPKSLSAHRGAVLALAISKDGKTLLSGGRDNLAKLWSLPDGKLIATLDGHKQPVDAVAISPDGKIFYSASQDSTARIWGLPKPGAAAPPPQPKQRKGAGAQHKISGPRGTPIATLEGHTGAVVSLVLSPDGRLLATGSQDAAIRVWSVPEGKLTATLGNGASNPMRILFSSNGKLLASHGDRAWQVWSMPDGHVLGARGGREENIDAIALLPDSSALLSSGPDRELRFWSLPGLDLLGTVAEFEAGGGGMEVSADGGKLVALRDSGIDVWLLPEGRHLARLATGRSRRFNAFRLSSDGSLLAAAAGGSVHLWSLRDLRFLALFDCQASGTVEALEFTPDGRLLACATNEGAILLWDVNKRSLHGMLFDPAANTSDVKGLTYTARDELTGQTITYTMPCGSPIPPGAVCVCNCVPGSACSCVSVSHSGGGGGYRSCSCVPVHYWYPN